MNTRPKSWLRIWCKRLSYLALALLLLCAIIYLLGWYSDWKEQQQLDEMLAELDRTEPGWRWKDFLPTPLQPGQENGALRFIEFGKTIDPKIIIADPLISDDEWFEGLEPPNWLERPPVQSWYKKLLEKTKKYQQESKTLVGLKPSAIPRVTPRQPGYKSLLGEMGPQEWDDFFICWRFFGVLSNAAANKNDPDLAINTTRSQLAILPAVREGWVQGGMFGFHRTMIRVIQRTLALTQPTEPALAALQNDCHEWTKYLLVPDDIRRDRAVVLAFLDEATDVANQDSQQFFRHEDGKIASDPDRWDMYEGWRHVYAFKTPWESINDWIKQKRLFLPSRESVYRRECIKNLRVHQQLIQLVQLPIDAWADEWKTISENEERRREGQVFNYWFKGRMDACIGRCLEMHTRIRAFEAAIACERFRIKNGHWPERWEDIVPSFLEKTPLNAKTHQSLIMKRLTNGFVVYGLGNDGTDHGGDVLIGLTLEGSASFDEDGFIHRHSAEDIGFRLFDPAARRQPAPPKPKKTPSPE